MFRPETHPQYGVFLGANFWKNADAPTTSVSLQPYDSYANLVLVFPPYDDRDYLAVNNLGRSVSPTNLNNRQVGLPEDAGLTETMLNELRFEGNYGGPGNNTAVLTRHPLMFVNSLSGAGPKISLLATKSSAGSYTYRVEMDLVLYDSLEITGDSQLQYEITGQMRDFYEPRNLTKTGTSSVTLRGHNNFRGDTFIQGGLLTIDGADAAPGWN